MKTKMNHGTIPGWLSAAVIGGVIAIIISIGISMLAANLLLNGRIGETAVGILTFVARLLSVVLGCLIGTNLHKEKCIQTVAVICAVYLIVLIAMGIILFDGSFHQFGAGLLSVIAGGAIACLIKLRPKKNKNHAVRVHR